MKKRFHPSMSFAVWLSAPALAKFIDEMIEVLLPKLKPAQQTLVEKKLII
ncbi:hypothetical protein [Candidatus Nanopusillus massiliensis]|nr:hypothetical protein [Candidatus Nanopusillus massiliensis]